MRLLTPWMQDRNNVGDTPKPVKLHGLGQLQFPCVDAFYISFTNSMVLALLRYRADGNNIGVGEKRLLDIARIVRAFPGPASLHMWC